MKEKRGVKDYMTLFFLLAILEVFNDKRTILTALLNKHDSSGLISKNPVDL